MDSWASVDIQNFKRTLKGEIDAKMDSVEVKVQEEVQEIKNMIDIKFKKDIGDIRSNMEEL